MRLGIVRFPVAVRTERRRVLNRVVASIRQLDGVMNFEVWRTVRAAKEWSRLFAPLAHPLGTKKYFSRNIWITQERGDRHGDTRGLLRRSAESGLTNFRIVIERSRNCRAELFSNRG